MSLRVLPNRYRISYLPLSHVAEQLISVWAPTMTGHCTYFAAGDALRGSLVRTMRQVCPTVFFAVPRVWEKIQEKMKERSAGSGGNFYFLWPVKILQRRTFVD